jgi:hypothetical protein
MASLKATAIAPENTLTIAVFAAVLALLKAIAIVPATYWTSVEFVEEKESWKELAGAMGHSQTSHTIAMATACPMRMVMALAMNLNPRVAQMKLQEIMIQKPPLTMVLVPMEDV